MLKHDRSSAALELRAALAQTESVEIREGFTPDAAARDFAAHHVGPPAGGRCGAEPALLYPQPGRPTLSFGAYGCETRVRGWLPGLPNRVAPSELGDLVPILPKPVQTTDHGDFVPASLAELPIPMATKRDAGRYLSMGFVMARSNSGAVALSAHRMLVLGPTRLGLWMLPGRKLRQMAAEAHVAGKGFPVSVNIGVPPAGAVASATSTEHLPACFDKLSLAGGLAQSPICISAGTVPDVWFLGTSEIVLEGHILPEVVPEAEPGAALAGSMPEFLGYDGKGQEELAVLELSGMRMRPDPIFHAVVGPGREQSVILGLGGALTLGLATGRDLAIHDLRFSHAGGGMLLLFVALRPGRKPDPQTLAAELIDVCPFIKMIVFVDTDVDLGSDEDVLWAMTTRSRLAHDCHALPGYRALTMDPSQSDAWSAQRGGAFKSYVDATLPEGLAALGRRSFR